MMKKGYFAVWYGSGSENNEFEATTTYKNLALLKSETSFFEEPVAKGHVVIFHCDGNKFYPVEECWMPIEEPKLLWRKFATNGKVNV